MPDTIMDTFLIMFQIFGSILAIVAAGFLVCIICLMIRWAIEEKRGGKHMNAKQALKSVTKQLEEQKFYNAMASADIKDYNAVIDHMIGGGSPCDWCQDKEECQLQSKAEGKGCSEWMLRDQPREVIENAQKHS